jgi:hypothetical protein
MKVNLYNKDGSTETFGPELLTSVEVKELKKATQLHSLAEIRGKFYTVEINGIGDLILKEYYNA